MRQMSDLPFRRVHFSRQLLRRLPVAVREAAEDASEGRPGNETASARSLVVLKAAEVLQEADEYVPDWADAETAYLIVADVPEPALFRLPTILGVHKPDQRIHVTRDADAVKRQAIALTRDRAIEGIVDAYVLWRDLWVVLGDMSIRCFPTARIGFLAGLSDQQLQDFQIHSSGSYLLWRCLDLRVGASQLIQAVDPMHLADVMIEGYAAEKVSLALRLLREERGLTQAEIGGLSERQVRRLEREGARLTSATAKKYAQAFGISVNEFLDGLGRSLRRLKDETELTESYELTREGAPLVPG